MSTTLPSWKIRTAKMSYRFFPNGGDLAKPPPLTAAGKVTPRNQQSMRTPCLPDRATLEESLKRLLDQRDKLIEQGKMDAGDTCWFHSWLNDESPPLFPRKFPEDEQVTTTVEPDCIVVTFAGQESASPQPIFKVFYTRNTDGTVKAREFQWREELLSDGNHTDTKSFVTVDGMNSYKQAVPSYNERIGLSQIPRDSFLGIGGALKNLCVFLKYVKPDDIGYLGLYDEDTR
jgi:hypothetical protein